MFIFSKLYFIIGVSNKEVYMKKIFSERLQEALNLRGMKQVDLVEKTGISKSAISQYLSGEFQPKQSNTYKIAQALNVNEAWLLGYNVPIEENRLNIFDIPNIMPLNTKKVPLLGSIAAGAPILAVEHSEDYIECAEHVRADFCLRIKGDSMAPRINDGDIVFIHRQPEIENGQIAAVYIDGEATLKRVYKASKSLQLIAENPDYPPIVCTHDNCDDIQIIGKAIAFQRYLK